jgi:hypothetical protein
MYSFQVPASDPLFLQKKSKFVSVYAINAYRWNGGVAPLIPNLGARRRIVVSFTLSAL